MKKKVIEYCPYCECEHELDYIEKLDKVVIKKEEIEYESHYFYCDKHPEEDEGFVTGKMMDENLLRARNAYRNKHGLLTSDEIVDIRKKYGLSQVELSKLLGWGGATISRYETKQIQDEAYDELLKQVRDNPMFVYKSLLRHKEAFSSDRFEILKSRLNDLIKQNDYLGRELLSSYYVAYNDPSEYNGFTKLNIDKLIACISYMASKIELYKTKCMKLLWYIDNVSYKEHDKAITGLVYCHQDYGALPLGTIMELNEVKVESKYNDEGSETFRIYPNIDVDLTVLSNDDYLIIDRILDKLGNMKTKELVDYMHQEKAYINTQLKQVIPFKYANELNDF